MTIRYFMGPARQLSPSEPGIVGTLHVRRGSLIGGGTFVGGGGKFCCGAGGGSSRTATNPFGGRYPGPTSTYPGGSCLFGCCSCRRSAAAFWILSNCSAANLVRSGRLASTLSPNRNDP